MFTREQLINIGGREWTKYNKHRIYFNPPMTIRLFDISFTTRDMQTIESAVIGDRVIQIKDAIHILDTFEYGRVWYDFSDNEFHFTGDGAILGVVVERIKALVNDIV
jgi:hypothetical protein